jgi:hypothetical protein
MLVVMVQGGTETAVEPSLGAARACSCWVVANPEVIFLSTSIWMGSRVILSLPITPLESTEFYLSCRPTSGNLHGQA